MKKSLVIFNWRDPMHPNSGGSEEYLLNYGRELSSRGWRVTWLTSRAPGENKNEIIDGIQIKRRGGFISKHIILPLQYIIYERKHSTHIIDSANGVPFFTPLFSRKKISLLIHHVHQDVFKNHLILPLSTIACFIEKNIMSFIYRNKKVFVVSPSTKREVIDLGFKEKNIELIHNTIDINKYNPKIKPDYPIFTYLGRVTKQKNIETFVDSIPEIKQQFPNAKFVIAGTGPNLEKLKEYSEKIDIDFKGFISEEEKIELLQESYVLIQPSKKEGWGITIIEANACGTPCVASNVSGLKDSIENGTNGYLFEFNNPKDLVLKILEIKNEYTTIQSSSIEYAKQFEIGHMTNILESKLLNI
jgi:glycosyltransferase involved in cell wall biosynthesis